MMKMMSLGFHNRSFFNDVGLTMRVFWTKRILPFFCNIFNLDGFPFFFFCYFCIITSLEDVDWDEDEDAVFEFDKCNNGLSLLSFPGFTFWSLSFPGFKTFPLLSGLIGVLYNGNVASIECFVCFPWIGQLCFWCVLCWNSCCWNFLVYKSDRGTPPNGTSLLESILITGMAIGVIGDDSDIGLIGGDEMKIGWTKSCIGGWDEL